MTEFHALGPVEAIVCGRPVDVGAPKQRTLLALLVSQAGRPVTTDVIVEALWQGSPPPSAMTSLQAYVAKLRKVLEPGRAPRTPARILRTCAQGYLLDAGTAEVDAHTFVAHAEAGRQARDRDDPHRALHAFDAGLTLWRGQAYTEAGHVPCVVPEVARLEELRLSVVEMRCAALLALGAHEVAGAELSAFLTAHPLREYGCELLSLSLYRAGRQADALEVLRSIQRRLSEELGVDPSPRLRHMRQQILHQDPALGWQPAPAPAAQPAPAPAARPEPVPAARPAAACRTQPAAAAAAPLLPLRSAATTAPAAGGAGEVFVGREAAIRQLTEALAAAEAGRGQVVTVSGEPGAGKTSLLRRFAERSGVPVLRGTCPEDLAVLPLSLWEPVLRAADAAFPHRPPPRPVTELLNAAARRPANGPQPPAGPRLIDAIARHLTGLSRSGALVVMLDHLHRADPASLRMLARLTRSMASSRLLVIASHRPDGAPALAPALTAPGVHPTRMELAGLTPRDTRALAGALTGRDVSSRAAEELCARSQGNPLLLREMIRVLACGQRPDTSPTVPAPVREVVLRRVERLRRPAAELLAVAAAAGRHFDAEVVADAASIGLDTALAALDHAIAAGLITEDEQRLGWFCFTDALVADALYAATGRMRRDRLRLQIAAAAGRAWVPGRPAGQPPPRPLAGAAGPQPRQGADTARLEGIAP
ncbi:BTAD domain-containing putative transcriptional regulator [Streptomyces sp. Qhu-G9]|uniref:BTAD domain-containing putative transcriptional regulator n=1 Tax=Streptomyces sp. Qhu-G9 TaxID=3452799 RepID=UPI0022AC3740|nr:BTAD domain-containing putative transcriptional regulator [Streptomyces aurantiacus]WAU82275.1 BTAD domain-containing putative transcriptional regulator [Streptomyces aurantiacus]